jgi:hypothetical protein
MSYGIIFWRNSTHAMNIFNMQKWIIRIMTKSGNMVSCRPLIKQLEILPFQSQYILSLLLFVVKNKESFSNNQEIHNINTRYNLNLHPSLCNLALFQKGVYYTGIKLFNHLPLQIKRLENEIKLFKPAVKKLLIFHSFIHWKSSSKQTLAERGSAYNES